MAGWLSVSRKLVIVCIMVIGVLCVWKFYQQARLAIDEKRYRYLDVRKHPNNKIINDHSALSQELNKAPVSNNIKKFKELILQPNQSHTKNKSRTSQTELNKRAVTDSPSVNDKRRKNGVTTVAPSPNLKLELTFQNGTLNNHDTLDFIDIEQHMPNLDALFNRTVIVTAISENHLGEAKGMIASAQRYMPHNKIIVYDLGLSSHGAKRVAQICNVELRSFPFEKYPPHVKNIHTYAWKPLIILESLKEFGAIFYGDSSVRFLDSLKILYPYLKQNHGFMQHIHHFDPRALDAQYHMTHPGTFKELGVDRAVYAKDIGFTPWISAGRVLHVNSSYMHEKVLGPLVECSLRQECISPKGGHRGKGNHVGVNHPHRFDSSVLALVVYKNMRGFYNADNNSTELYDKVVKIERKDFSVKGLKFKPHCHKMFQNKSRR